MSAATLIVHTLTIDHRHGTNTNVFATAQRALDEWVELYWHTEVPQTTERPMDPEAALEVYFETAGESYTLDQAELTLDADHRLAEITGFDEVSDLVASKIELLAEYKLEYPQDYDEADIEAMKAEITRLEGLRDRLAALHA